MQASNEECKQASVVFTVFNDSQCQQAMKKSKQAALYRVSISQ